MVGAEGFEPPDLRTPGKTATCCDTGLFRLTKEMRSAER
jgi:hypothetical protein